MATTVTWDQILDRMVGKALALRANDGQALTADKPVWHVARYAGEFTSPEAQQRGVACRTPAVLFAFAGEKSVGTTIGRRRDKVEASLLAICISDSVRSRDDRDRALPILHRVRDIVGARRFGLAITRLRYEGVVTVSDDEKLLAYAARFTTRYHVDYTVAPPATVIETATGSFGFPDEKGGAEVVRRDLTFQETP